MKTDSVWLDRGGCYGECPIYRVTLHADGRAVWDGEGFTERMGAFVGEIGTDEFAALARYVDECGFFGWADEYYPEAFVTDSPTYRIGVTGDGEAKEVLQYVTREPAGFGRLAKRIDKLAERIEWRALGVSGDGT